ncbi:MAG: RidA family protein [Nitrospinota bacterium]
MGVESRLRALGVQLPEAPDPVGSYVPAVQAGELLFISGQIPLEGGKLRYAGKPGAELDVEAGKAAARLCALNALAQVQRHLGSLDRVAQVVRLSGFIASAPGFTQQARVMDGASDLMVELFGEAGRHARLALGAPELPLGAPVELETIFEVR